MFNFREPRFVPGFHVREPKEEVPGFRLAPDGSIRQSSADVDSSTQRGLAPENWLQPTFNPAPTANFAFLGGGVAGMARHPALPAVQDFEPVAAGDLKCQACASGGDYGTTGAYRIENRILCQKCAVKHLGFGNEPSSTQPGLLRPWILDRK